MTRLSKREFGPFWASHRPRRIIVVGSCGAGKSTLALKLGELLNRPSRDIDDLYWEPGWQGVSDEELRRRLSEFIAGEAWTLAGNYSRTQDLTWPRADLIVWLDLNLPLVFGRVVRRCLRRASRREMICNGNYESLRMTFCSKESLLIWQLKSYGRQRRQYLARLAEPGTPPMLQLKSPADVGWLLEQIWLREKPAPTVGAGLVLPAAAGSAFNKKSI